MHEKEHECGCHGDGGCDCPIEERIKAMELTKELMLHRVRCMERKIQGLKKEAKKSGSK